MRKTRKRAGEGSKTPPELSRQASVAGAGLRVGYLTSLKLLDSISSRLDDLLRASCDIPHSIHWRFGTTAVLLHFFEHLDVHSAYNEHNRSEILGRRTLRPVFGIAR